MDGGFVLPGATLIDDSAGVPLLTRPASYQSHTFTIGISPMFSTSTAQGRQLADFLDRKLTFSYSTLLFLQEHGFDLAEALGRGVPYLSRNEVNDVRDWLYPDEKKKYGSLVLADLTDVDAEFCHDFRGRVCSWMGDYPATVSIYPVQPLQSVVDNLKHEVLRIFDPRGGNLRRSTTRIAFQLIRDEFPGCHCWRDRDNWALNVTLLDDDANIQVRDSLLPLR